LLRQGNATPQAARTTGDDPPPATWR
jgi:hypothetical protein